MIAVSAQNIELILAKEGVRSPVGRATVGHQSPPFASNEVSNERARLLSYLDCLCQASVDAWNIWRIHQRENDFLVQFYFFLLKNSKAQPQAVETQSGHKQDEHVLSLFPGRERAREASPRPWGGTLGRQRWRELSETSLGPDQFGH